MHRCLLLLALAPLAGCGGDHRAASAARAAPRVISVGRPVRHDGTVELAARGAGAGSPGFRLAVPRAPGGDPRDLCVATVPAGLPPIEADRACDVRVTGIAAVFGSRPGIPEELGPSPTVVAGIAPRGVARVEIDGPGGRRVLPLSRHRAFLALYAPGTRGRARVVSRATGGGRTVRVLTLPLARHARPLSRHRRRGAVFSDEVDEGILRRSYAQVLHRFGAPAARGRHRGRRCLNYEVVGEGPGGWWFCFRADGRMASAAHSS